ncbi:sucrase-isomaltase, intestinal-like [Acanthaster planci]|uniref:Sucrase-isomaltase, intestinal-like n=1 Tax=Acanthaster planci TaxID=133434 RepID=A0A8B7YKT7_ACAPL|nr:sucrase-isomaltase, intestinal-like [Acanthaster planci]
MNRAAAIIVGLVALAACLFLVMLPSLIVTARPYGSWKFQVVECRFSAQNEENSRLDCFPELNMPTERECRARGCCFVDVTFNRELVVPECYLPSGVGYEVMGKPQVLTSGYNLYLQRIRTPRLFYREAENLVVHVDEQAENRLHIKISEYRYVTYQDWKFPELEDRMWTPRYEVPIDVTKPARQAAWTDYIFNYTQSPFTMQLTRRTSQRFNMIDTTLGALIFEDQFLQITFKLPNSLLYGFGEHRRDDLRHDMNWKEWGMFSAPGHPDDDTQNANLYGHHPFFLNVDDDGNAFGMYFHNSNAMDVHLTPMPAVTWRTTGGILDFYIFTGPSPEQVIQQYQEVIGRPEIPPYWALGLQLGIESFGSAQAMENFVQENVEAEVPFDVIFSGMDYQRYYLTFTHDEAKVRKSFIDNYLHPYQYKYVIHLTPALSSQIPSPKFNYWPYYYAKKHGILVNRTDGVTPAFGVSWHGETAYMDFTHEFAKVHWGAFAQMLHQDLPFDGIIMTENEPGNFMNGSRIGCDLESKWNAPPYNPKLKSSMLYYETLCMDSKLAKGIHYNVHSLYGHFAAEASNYAGKLLYKDKRAMTLSRASFAGTGQFAGHFLGRSTATWKDMTRSIIGVDEFNMFGIPFTGADICGTVGEPESPELCQRWMQLGAYQPLARIYRSLNTSRVDPAAFRFTDTEIFTNMREMARRRYSILPYLYTQLYHAHVDGYAVTRAPFYDFISDKIRVWDVDWEFMLGNALLVVPVVKEGARTVTMYHPEWRFYYFYDPQDAGHVLGSILETASKGSNTTVSAPLNEIPVFIRGEYIIATQEPGNNTYYTRMNPLTIWVAMPENNEDFAKGDLWWDDGETQDTYERDMDIYMQFFADLLKLEMLSQRIGMVAYNSDAVLPTINKVKFVGLRKDPAGQLYVDNVQHPTTSYTYDGLNQVLDIWDLDLDITSDHRIDLQSPY